MSDEADLAVRAGEHLDPVCYANVQLTDEQASALAAGVTTNLMAKVDAGARLFFALYHHPKAKELITGELWSMGLTKAYMDAQRAYMPDRQNGGG